MRNFKRRRQKLNQIITGGGPGGRLPHQQATVRIGSQQQSLLLPPGQKTTAKLSKINLKQGRIICKPPTAGDGNCFFHSLACLMNWKDWWHVHGDERIARGFDLRRFILKRMSDTDRVQFSEAKNNYEACFLEHRNMSRKHFKRHVKSFADAHRLLSEPTSWATGAVIIFSCFILCKQLLVIDESNGSLFCGTYLNNPNFGSHCTNDPSTVVFINWTHDRSHFEPLVRVKDHNTVVRLQFRPDDPMVKTILNTYQYSCGWSRDMMLR